MKCFLFGADNTGPSSSVQYNRINATFQSSWASSSPAAQIVAPVAMDLSNFYFQATTPPGTGNSLTITVLKNGSPTSLELTIADTATSAQDTTHVASFAAGDTISLRSTPTGTPTDLTNHYWNVQVESAGHVAPLLTGLAQANTSTTQYGVMLAGHGTSNGWSTTEQNMQVVVPSDGVLTGLYATVHTAPLSGRSWEFTLMKNGVATSLQATIANSAIAGNNTSTSVSVAAGDTLSVRCVPISSPAAGVPSIGVAFVPNNVGENFMGFGSAQLPSTTAVSYEQLLGNGNNGWVASANRYMMPGPSTIRGLYVKLYTAPGVGKSWTFRLTKSTGDTSLAVVIADNNTSGFALGNIECTQGELIILKCTPNPLVTGGPAAATGGVHAGLLLYNDPKAPVVVIY